MSGIPCWGIIILGIAVAVIIWKSLEDFRNNLLFVVLVAMGMPIHILVWIIRKIWPGPGAEWRVLGGWYCDDSLRIVIGILFYSVCPYILYYLRSGHNILVLIPMLLLGFFAGILAGSLSKFWHPMGREQVMYKWFGIQDTDRKEELARKRLAKQLWEKVKDTNVPQLLRALANTHPFGGSGSKGDFDQIVKELADYPDRETVVELLALNLENTDMMDPTISLDVAHTWGDALVAMGEDAVERLIACLDHEKFWVRIVAISALRRIGDRRAVQPFIKILQESPDGKTASVVADALALIAEPDSEVINALKETLERKETWPAPFAEAALDRWSQKARKAGEDK